MSKIQEIKKEFLNTFFTEISDASQILDPESGLREWLLECGYTRAYIRHNLKDGYIGDVSTKSIIDSYTSMIKENYIKYLQNFFDFVYNQNDSDIFKIYERYRVLTPITSSNYQEITHLLRFMEWVKDSRDEFEEDFKHYVIGDYDDEAI